MKRWAPRVVVVAALLALMLWVGFTPDGCRAMDWKWASVDGRCVTPLCSFTGGCGEWASPVSRCDRVKPGAAPWRVWFELGEPRSADGGVARFSASKGSSDEIIVGFRDGRVSTVVCPR